MHRDRLAGLFTRSVSLPPCSSLARSLTRVVRLARALTPLVSLAPSHRSSRSRLHTVRLARALALPLSCSLPLRLPPLFLSLARTPCSPRRSLPLPLTPRRQPCADYPLCLCLALPRTSPTPCTVPMRLRIDRCAQSPRGSRFVSSCSHHGWLISLHQSTLANPYVHMQ